jgi:hypothetical protein
MKYNASPTRLPNVPEATGEYPVNSAEANSLTNNDGSAGVVGLLLLGFSNSPGEVIKFMECFAIADEIENSRPDGYHGNAHHQKVDEGRIEESLYPVTIVVQCRDVPANIQEKKIEEYRELKGGFRLRKPRSVKLFSLVFGIGSKNSDNDVSENNCPDGPGRDEVEKDERDECRRRYDLVGKRIQECAPAGDVSPASCHPTVVPIRHEGYDEHENGKLSRRHVRGKQQYDKQRRQEYPQKCQLIWGCEQILHRRRDGSAMRTENSNLIQSTKYFSSDKPMSVG